MSEILKAETRDKLGKIHSRRLRTSGRIPAVLYGHGEDVLNLALSREQLRTALRHGAKLVELQGAAAGKALLQDLQWDPFGRELLHVDLLRVHADDRVTVEVPIELKGEAPGEREGGLVTVVVHEIAIETAPDALPERLHVDVSDLHMGATVTAEKIIDLPAGSKLLAEPSMVLATCVAPAAEPEEPEVVAETGEPEVVGKKEEDEEGGAEGSK